MVVYCNSKTATAIGVNGNDWWITVNGKEYSGTGLSPANARAQAETMILRLTA